MSKRDWMMEKGTGSPLGGYGDHRRFLRRLSGEPSWPKTYHVRRRRGRCVALRLIVDKVAPRPCIGKRRENADQRRISQQKRSVASVTLASVPKKEKRREGLAVSRRRKPEERQAGPKSKD